MEPFTSTNIDKDSVYRCTSSYIYDIDVIMIYHYICYSSHDQPVDQPVWLCTCPVHMDTTHTPNEVDLDMLYPCTCLQPYICMQTYCATMLYSHSCLLRQSDSPSILASSVRIPLTRALLLMPTTSGTTSYLCYSLVAPANVYIVGILGHIKLHMCIHMYISCAQEVKDRICQDWSSSLSDMQGVSELVVMEGVHDMT